MNRIICLFMFLLSTNVFGEENYLDQVKAESAAFLSHKIGDARVSELVVVDVEVKSFLTFRKKSLSVNKVIFIDPKSEIQRAPNQNTPHNIEARMAELHARIQEGASPTIYMYKAYVVVTGGREKISEETYDSYFQVKK